jgi:hypothetical protein
LTPIPVVDPSLQRVPRMLIQLHVFGAETIGLPPGDGEGVGVGVALRVGVGVGVGVDVGVGVGVDVGVGVAVGVGAPLGRVLAVGVALGVGLTPGLVLPRGLGVGLGLADGVTTGTATEPAEPPLPLHPAAIAAAAPTKSNATTAILRRMHHLFENARSTRSSSIAPSGIRVDGGFPYISRPGFSAGSFAVDVVSRAVTR